MTVHVRDAGPEDRRFLVESTLALNLHEHRMRKDRDTTVEGAAAHLNAMESEIAEQGGFILVAESGGVPAGFLIGVAEVEQGHFVVPEQRTYGCITDIYVSDLARGKGVSRLMMAEAMNRFRGMGLKRALVTGLASNPLASAAYPALGFELLYNTYEKRLDD